jgi:hypothetical protein
VQEAPEFAFYFREFFLNFSKGMILTKVVMSADKIWHLWQLFVGASVLGCRGLVTKGPGQIENKVAANRRAGHLGNLAPWPLKCEYTGQLVVKTTLLGEEDTKCGNKRVFH